MRFLKRVFMTNKIPSQLSLMKKEIDANQLALGKLLVNNVQIRNEIKSLSEVEFKIFSQFGDDGIIQWLVSHLDIPNFTFIEFGVEDYMESNTRFLMMNNNWSGFVMDGSEKNVSKIVNSEYYWRYDITAKAEFINKNNINDLIRSSGFKKEIGILHIDLDGNDYWIWEQIDCIDPIVVILEYNSVFGENRLISVPYDSDFYRTKAHHSNLYWGSSISALNHLSEKKGYSFVGSNSAGNNAYFVRNDKLNEIVKKITISEGYIESKYRESRDLKGKLTYTGGLERVKLIQGLEVYNILTNKIEKL